MMKQPSVTACLTVYNAEDFLEQALGSLTAQSWENLNIVISDDASSDDTPAIIDRFARKVGSKIQSHRQEQRLGWVDNTNFILSKVETDYFFLCYHDDIVEPAYVESLATCLEKDQGLIGAYSDLALKKPGKDTTIKSYDLICDIDDPVERGLSIIRMQGMPWVSNRGMYRSSVLKTVGGLRKNLAGEFSAAFPWVLGLALEGRFARVPEVLCHKFKYETGVSHNWKKTYREFFAMYHDLVHTIWNSSLSNEQKDILLLEVTRRSEELLLNRKLV